MAAVAALPCVLENDDELSTIDDDVVQNVVLGVVMGELMMTIIQKYVFPPESSNNPKLKTRSQDHFDCALGSISNEVCEL